MGEGGRGIGGTAYRLGDSGRYTTPFYIKRSRVFIKRSRVAELVVNDGRIAH